MDEIISIFEKTLTISADSSPYELLGLDPSNCSSEDVRKSYSASNPVIRAACEHITQHMVHKKETEILSGRLYNPIPFNLTRESDGGIYTYSFIRCGTILGEIRGYPAYIWEMFHSHYMIVDRDYVIDVLDEYSILGYIREENATNNVGNCTIVSTDEETPRFYIQATRDIVATSEMVYYVLY